MQIVDAEANVQKEREDALVVKDVSKDFFLPHEQSTSIKTSVVNLMRKRKVGGTTQHALKDISFTIKKGEFFGIVGRNGSGKSTLLKILAEIYTPTSGSASHTGKLVPFIELGVGFNPELTGRENVFLNGALLGFTRTEIAKMYDEIVRFAELEAFMDQKLKNYSSGMQVRLAFSVATRAQADILVVDEVLAVGDADFQRKCYNHFRKLKKDNKTVVFVSHDMGAVREYCDRAIMIEKSRIVAEGNVEKVASAYTKMFMKEQSDQSDPHEETADRWGNKRMTYTSVKSSKHEYEGFENIKVDCTVTANEDVGDDYVLGFSIRNSTGSQVLGVNNKIIKVTVPKLSKGESTQISWEFKNMLNDGSYGIDATVINPDTTIYDWWENAAEFIVYKEERTPYPIMPEIGLDIKTR